MGAGPKHAKKSKTLKATSKAAKSTPKMTKAKHTRAPRMPRLPVPKATKPERVRRDFVDSDFVAAPETSVESVKVPVELHAQTLNKGAPFDETLDKTLDETPQVQPDTSPDPEYVARDAELAEAKKEVVAEEALVEVADNELEVTDNELTEEEVGEMNAPGISPEPQEA